MGTALAIIAASFFGDATYQEVKQHKETGDISGSAKNVLGDMAGKTGTALGKALVDIISKSL